MKNQVLIYMFIQPLCASVSSDIKNQFFLWGMLSILNEKIHAENSSQILAYIVSITNKIIILIKLGHEYTLMSGTQYLLR